MKQKIITYLKENKGSISLFAIVFIVTVVTTVVASLCSAENLTQVVLSASAGIIAYMGIGELEKLLGMKLGESCDPAILAIIIGVLIALL